MNCPKCQGAMSYEKFIGGERQGFAWIYDGWRCVYCGEVVDALILKNRMRMRAAEGHVNSGQTGYIMRTARRHKGLAAFLKTA